MPLEPANLGMFNYCTGLITGPTTVPITSRYQLLYPGNGAVRRQAVRDTEGNHRHYDNKVRREEVKKFHVK